MVSGKGSGRHGREPGDRGHRRRSEPEGEWGGRIGAQLHQLDRAARAAIEDAANALRSRATRPGIGRPLMVIGAAFGAGILIALIRKRRANEDA